MRKIKFTICIITVLIIVLTSLSQLNSQNNPNMKKGFYLVIYRSHLQYLKERIIYTNREITCKSVSSISVSGNKLNLMYILKVKCCG